MKNEKLLLGAVLFLLGLIGVFSILTMELPIPENARSILESRYSPMQIKLLLLLNPAVMLAVFVLIGTRLYDKVGLSVPLIEGMIRKKDIKTDAVSILKNGVAGGVVAGILLVVVGFLFTPYLPEEFKALGEKLQPSLAARFLYGGITEEILMRFGLMTLLVWLFLKIFKTNRPAIYWGAIVFSALLFALGHFPVAYQAVGAPSALLLTYIVVGNAIGGIVFGWLYWKAGLESAFIAHIFAHIVMVLAQ
jgi:membrane protease YdiL (CAAX protease family)